MQTYRIAIDEEQRTLISDALSLLTTQEAENLRQLIEGLPDQERQTPRNLHGLCL